VRQQDAWLLPPAELAFARAVEACAAAGGCASGVTPSQRFLDPETSLAVFHGASPW
jgi:hypothetical protein